MCLYCDANGKFDESKETRLEVCSKVKRLVALPKTLTFLIVKNNSHINGLPILPEDLLYLECVNCPKLMVIAKFPDKLDGLILDNIGLQILPQFPKSLGELTLKKMNIEVLPRLNPDLVYLELRNLSKLKKIDNLPKSLNNIIIRDCQSLTNVPLVFKVSYEDKDFFSFDIKRCGWRDGSELSIVFKGQVTDDERSDDENENVDE